MTTWGRIKRATWSYDDLLAMEGTVFACRLGRALLTYYETTSFLQGGVKRGQGDEQSEIEEEGEIDDEGQGPYTRSVAFREYVQYSGPLGLAAQIETQSTAEQLSSMLLQLNYLGKRGSFFQIDGPPVVRDHLPIGQGYLQLDEEEATARAVSQGYTLQVLDDWSPKMTFDKANIYSDAPIAVGKDRIPRPVLLPYRVIRSSQGFTLYQRTDLP